MSKENAETFTRSENVQTKPGNFDMTDEAKALVERLRRFSSRPMEHDAPVMNRIAMDQAADLIETQAREIERQADRIAYLEGKIEGYRAALGESHD